MMNRDFLIEQTKFLSRLPGVEAIFLSGSQTQGTASKNSDIDLFIIANPGRIWTARFFVYTRLFLTGKMRRKKNTKDLFCPNHFITADNLEIQEKDAYSANLFSHNIPLYDVNNIFVQFAKINQSWVGEFGESFDSKWLVANSEWQNHSQHSTLCILHRWQESLLKHIQITKIKLHPDIKLPGAKIILTDTELRFHPRPRNRNWKKNNKA